MDFSLKLMPFQKDGVDFLASHRRAMLAWEMGTGKTPTAVRACVKVGARNILVFCPLIATGVWSRHFHDWSYYPGIHVSKLAEPLPKNFIRSGVTIIPYSQASIDAPVMETVTLAAHHWDVVILDEVHYLKNSKAKRTQAIYGPALNLGKSPLAFAGHVWALSGTPILNNASEFWTHLHALSPDSIRWQTLGVMSERAFVDRYCIVKPTTYGFKVEGSRNREELSRRVKGFMDRKRSVDVLKDLPPLRTIEYPLPDDTYIHPEVLDAMRQALDNLGDDANGDDDEILAAIQRNLTKYSTVRRLIGGAKADGAASLVEDMLGDDPACKVIVFAHHRDVIDQLEVLLRHCDPLVIHGGVSQTSRDLAIKLFQEAPRHRVIIISVEAAGEAITLTAASNVVIVEPSVVPAKNAQAIARAHRMGQKNPVIARFVILPGDFDRLFMGVLARKTRDIMGIIDPDLVTTPRKTVTFPQETLI